MMSSRALSMHGLKYLVPLSDMFNYSPENDSREADSGSNFLKYHRVSVFIFSFLISYIYIHIYTYKYVYNLCVYVCVATRLKMEISKFLQTEPRLREIKLLKIMEIIIIIYTLIIMDSLQITTHLIV